MPKPNKWNALVRDVYVAKARALTTKHAFGCFLDELPFEPSGRETHYALDATADDSGLIVNPSFYYQLGSDPPEQIRRHASSLDSFLGEYPIAWVGNAGTQVWIPFWVRGEWIETLKSLQPGAPVPSALRPAMRRALAAADILVARNHEQALRARWHQICETAQQVFKADGYAIVGDLIHPQQLAAMQRYYRALVAAGELQLGDDQVPDRYVLHSEVLAAFFHQQLTHLVSQVAGEQVKPSYVYFASYRSGASLPPHRDREQCEFSISLLADYRPQPDGPCGWPLVMEDPKRPDKAGAADLGIGDCVVYRGRALMHSRPPLPAGHQSTSIFLHYVRSDFTGDLW